MKKLSKHLLFAFLLALTVIVASACSSVTVPETVEEPEEAVVEEAAEEVMEEEAMEEEAAEEVMEEEAAEEAAEEVMEEEAAEEAAEEVMEEEAAEEVMEEEVMEEVAMADSININFALGNNQRTLTYNQPTPLELPDGTVIAQGQLKPTWQYIQSELGMTINDVTIQDQKSSEMIEVSAATGFDNATIFGGNSVADNLMAFGAQGYFVPLNANLDQMPNFAAYLEANPNIAKAVTAYDGNIYHAPYAAEIGNYARVFNARTEWITGLLDSDDAIEAETNSITTAYSGYWARSDSNVIDMQNEAGGGELTAEVARATLIEYIAATYPDLENPSDLYIGVDAQYDIDELVALWRVVELSPNTVTKITTGEVVPDAQVDAFFTRRSRDRFDAFRLMTYWGGQRVFGSDATSARFYLDAEGELQFSFSDPGFLEAVGYMQQLYAEGLINADFFDTSNSDNFRSVLYGADDEEGHNQFGFMTIDWIASTTASNETVESILPPVTQVGASDEFIHFMENTRVIKPDGWAISTASTEEEINAALALFDYFYSDAGVIVQNYGPPFALVEGEVYLGSDGNEYPTFSDWTVEQSCEFKDCNMSSFSRDYTGSLIPLGYQKQIGFEMQTTINNGPAAWELYFTKGVVTPSYESVDPLFRLVPPVFSLTEQDTAKLGTLAVGEEQAEQIFLFIAGADTAVESTEALGQLYADAGVEDYLDVYRNAYTRSQE